ncbi:MAG: hypothetical protein A2Y03_08875 [Omnitrophica WOR_2 bacterium GWF2_38_59]|nr:MAG: hypothetical protein A2Y06_05335 [Omnitrophica WOR_2 bacterium GWA2_37_7]OGX22092.1 MAG: hypothetical protein A2Y03_08875 [Omnitrophica WOR_2 bacterium GWF2_38_59]OGX46734.1 MAG: hypothetical protein A2243_02505 [Omnitrophica WOR_2 bacterium RIFOXYA2_FULL_38_17]OGX53425.1 MAG: hypothetical protein A2267_09785 [Omnitrophica WOR_2 bacterium RIFOXYA12_FULL_38_10]OGX56605.1 MAG: hypothetical protein A2447_07180 [Omnitrophica WOR_2 bacterium RIFOXYC2_FULL_38_12]OGX59824.1 MAG: hypothetical 
MRKLFLIVIFLALTSFANADIITLKSGKVIEATIVQRTDDFVKVEVDGIELVLYTDEIESINDSNQKEDVAVKAEVPSDVAEEAGGSAIVEEDTGLVQDQDIVVKVNKPMIEEGTDNAEDVLEPASNEVMDDSAVEVEDAENMEEADIPQRNEEQIADDETEDIESAEELQDQGDMEELDDQGDSEEMEDQGDMEELDDQGDAGELEGQGNMEVLEDQEDSGDLVGQGNREELEDQEEAQEPTALETDVVIYDGDSTAEVKSEEETDDTGSEEAAEDLNMEAEN